jgi:hypothetical protein
MGLKQEFLENGSNDFDQISVFLCHPYKNHTYGIFREKMTFATGAEKQNLSLLKHGFSDTEYRRNAPK